VKQLDDSDGSIVEIGTVGPEGMVGISLLLGTDVMDNRAFMQVADSASRRAHSEDFSLMPQNSIIFCCATRLH